MALSLTGKIRPPRSSFNGTSNSSKKLLISQLKNLLNTLYKNLPLPGIFFTNSCNDAVFVTLQRPLPVINNFLPKRLFFSNNITSAPFCAALTAAMSPAAPPPTTITLRIIYLLFFYANAIIQFQLIFYILHVLIYSK